jgi:hypothetical protein
MRAARLRTGTAAVSLLSTVIAITMYHQLWADPLHRTLGSIHHTNDPMQTMWFLNWVPWSLAHGHNPFSTDLIYYPGGASLAWNTLMPTLGLLGAPLTFTFGASVTFAVLMTLSPVFASVTGYWWLRRHTERTWPAVAGGLLIGFNSYMAGHLLGHLNLTFVALIPVMAMLLEDLLYRHPRPDRRTAVYLGLVTAAQAGISEELILITCVGVLLAFLCYLALGPAPRLAAWRHLRAAGRTLGLAIAVFVVAAGPLLVDQLFLARTVPLDAAHWHAVGGDYLDSLGRQVFGFGGPHTTLVGGAEDGVYLGPVLLTVLGAAALVSAARDRLSRVAVVTAAALAVLTFGVSGPWGLVGNLPVLRSILPVRFSFAMFLVLAWLVARWLDQLAALARTSSSRRWAGRAGAVALAAALVTLFPAGVGATPLPVASSFFNSHLAAAIGDAGPVLLLPVPGPHDASGMYYQAQSHFSFAQPGGYALRPDGTGAAYGPPATPLVSVGTAIGRPAAGMLDSARRELAKQRYAAIIVVDSAPDATRLAALARRLTGRGPDLSVGGVRIWLLRRS